MSYFIGIRQSCPDTSCLQTDKSTRIFIGVLADTKYQLF